MTPLEIALQLTSNGLFILCVVAAVFALIKTGKLWKSALVFYISFQIYFLYEYVAVPKLLQKIYPDAILEGPPADMAYFVLFSLLLVIYTGVFTLFSYIVRRIHRSCSTQKDQQTDAATRHPFGTSLKPPTLPATRAGDTPEASCDS